MAYLILALYLVFTCTFTVNVLYLRSGRRRAERYAGPFPSVSICIPARNEEANIGRLLESLREQRYDDLEIIVYDDHSTDATAEIARSSEVPGLTLLHGEGPPPGWAGKPHALYQAASHASNDLLLFLDADTRLRGPQALRRMVAHHLASPEATVTTALPLLRGGGLLLVSMVPFVILTQLPWPLVRRLGWRSLGSLNGQCWMLERSAYEEQQPHRAVRDEVLEDVEIGRHLQESGIHPQLADFRDLFEVHMYQSLREAWTGFEKNAYLLMGGRALTAIIGVLFFAVVFTLPWLFSPLLLLPAFLLKLATDIYARIPLRYGLAAPLCYALATAIQIGSTLAHLTGRAHWKGRPVAPR